MSQPIHCPKCKGSGEISMLWGKPASIEPFSEEYDTLMKRAVPDYEKYEVLRLEGCSTVVKCPLCKGSGVILVTPAAIEGG